MINREMEERHLAQAERHIIVAEANVVKMRDMILSLEDKGRDASVQTKLLGTLLITLEQFYAHRALILEALGR